MTMDTVSAYRIRAGLLGSLLVVGLMTPAPAQAAKIPLCFGKRATIVGTPGNDRIIGTARADVIVGLGGVDRIYGRDGNDLICGGGDQDWLYGGPGHDKLRGDQVGDDDHFIPNRFFPGPGNDLVIGKSKPYGEPQSIDLIDYSGSSKAVDVDLLAHRVKIGGQVDRVYAITQVIGSRFDDVLRGAGAFDRLNGGAGNDRIEGRGNSDILSGDGGNDTLLGGANGDTIQPGPGHNTVRGGPGGDWITLFAGTSFDVDGGADDDELLFGGKVGVQINAVAGTVTGGLTGTFTGIEGYLGTNGQDTFIGSERDESYTSYEQWGPGDIVDLAGGNDRSQVRGRVLGGAGDDELHVNGAAYGGEGNDTLRATGDGKGIANAGLYGEAGNDSLSAEHRVPLFGGEGDDAFEGFKNQLSLEASAWQRIALLDGGPGHDWLRMGAPDDRWGQNRFSIDLNAGLLSAINKPAWRVPLVSIESAAGGSLADRIIGTDGDNTLIGGLGKDTIDGLGGVDTCVGELVTNCER